MIRRVSTIASFAFSTGLSLLWPCAIAAATHHAGAFATHGSGALFVGSGHGLGTSGRSTTSERPLLTVPVPGAVQERRKALESAPSPTLAPAAKINHDPFPDFHVPLRRHRMAMSDGAFPAFGDLSF